MRGIFLVAFLFFCLSPLSALAIGISPIRIIVPVEEGGISEETTFYISRADASREESFTVSASEPFVDLLGQETFSLPVGEQLVAFPFRVNASGYAVGNYKANIRLTPVFEPTEPGLSFVVALTGDVVMDVVAELPPVASEPEIFFPSLQVRDLLIRKHDKDRSTIIATFDVFNASDEELIGANYHVILERNNQIMIDRTVPIDALSSGESIGFTEELSDLPEGAYDISVHAETADGERSDTRSLHFTLEATSPQKTLFLLGTGFILLLAGFGSLLFFKKRKHSL